MSYYSPNNLWLDSSSKHQLYDSSSTWLGTRPCLDLLAKVWSLWTFLLSKIKGFNLGESRPQNLVVETSVFVPVVVVTVLHLHLIDKHVGLLVPITSNFWKIYYQDRTNKLSLFIMRHIFIHGCNATSEPVFMSDDWMCKNVFYHRSTFAFGSTSQTDLTGCLLAVILHSSFF